MVGVLVALVLRTIFIAAGAAIISTFSWVFYIFGAFLIWTAWKLVQDARKGHGDEEYEENKLLKAVERRFGVADRYHGTKLWVEQNGKRVMTPMMVVMLAIGSTDVLFALDSIPAIYGLTEEPYIVFTANAFALMACGSCTSSSAACSRGSSISRTGCRSSSGSSASNWCCTPCTSRGCTSRRSASRSRSASSSWCSR